MQSSEPDWSNVTTPLEDGSVNTYVARGSVAMAELLNPGSTSASGEVVLGSVPLPEGVEAAPATAPATGGSEKGKKGKGKKGKGKEEAAPAEPEEVGNPFVNAGTCAAGSRSAFGCRFLFVR